MAPTANREDFKMKLSEAKALAGQLNVHLPRHITSVRFFEEEMARRNLNIAVDNKNGDWVLLDSNKNVLARVS